MTTQLVDEYFVLNNGISVGHLTANRKPRRYRPPQGYSFYTEIIKFHPVTHCYLGTPQRWLFLIPNTINNIMSLLYLSKIDNAQALQKLIQCNLEDLAEKLLDCFCRGECRYLFCSPDGEPY
jgi:hypothetical protein